ncbi:MAG: ATP synthase F1 subunit delta [Bacteroidota bacterium]
MYQSLIATRYAKALFLKAREEEMLDQAMEEIRFVQSVFHEHSDVLTTLNHPVTYSSQKANILIELFQEKVHPIILDFLLLIARNHREAYFQNIFRDFTDYYNEDKGIKTVELTTAMAIGDDERSDIKQYIKDTFRANKITFTEKVNPELIGGFIIQIDDKLLDASVRKQLDKIRHNLVN